MSAHNDPEAPVPTNTGLKVTVVASSWHQQAMGGLIAGATKLLDQAGANYEVIMVPGTFELPVVAASAAPGVDAVVALGVVIRGGTRISTMSAKQPPTALAASRLILESQWASVCSPATTRRRHSIGPGCRAQVRTRDAKLHWLRLPPRSLSRTCVSG